jgi:hypothetical protein
VRTLLGQDPHTVTWARRVHRGEPMRLIQVEDVLDKLARIFEKGKSTNS